MDDMMDQKNKKLRRATTKERNMKRKYDKLKNTQCKYLFPKSSFELSSFSFQECCHNRFFDHFTNCKTPQLVF